MTDLQFMLFMPGSNVFLIYTIDPKSEASLTKEMALATKFSASTAMQIQKELKIETLIVLFNPNQKTMTETNNPTENSTENTENVVNATAENTNEAPVNSTITEVISETPTPIVPNNPAPVIEAANATDPILAEDMLEAKAVEAAKEQFKIGTEVEYQLTAEDVEKYNLHGSKKIRAFIKTLNFPEAELQITAFGASGETKLDIGKSTFNQMKKQPGTFCMI